MGHNESNSRRLNELQPGDEARVIKNTLSTIERATGSRPTGWLSSGLQETWHTFDLLASEGCEYVAGWVNDDQPYVMSLENRRQIISVPYNQVINDKSQYERDKLTPAEFQDLICRAFDVLYREGAVSRRVSEVSTVDQFRWMYRLNLMKEICSTTRYRTS